jgi:uncharacterized membrane protein YecN with MAPEG domain
LIVEKLDNPLNARSESLKENPHMLIVTSLIAATLTGIFIRLSFAVIGLRRKNKVGLGTGGHEDLERAIRAQGNFAEYVPFGLILLACLELNGAAWWLVATPGVTLIIGRLIHVLGINTPPPDFSKRVLGMKFTFFTLMALIALNLGWSLYKLAS